MVFLLKRPSRDGVTFRCRATGHTHAVARGHAARGTQTRAFCAAVVRLRNGGRIPVQLGPCVTCGDVRSRKSACLSPAIKRQAESGRASFKHGLGKVAAVGPNAQNTPTTKVLDSSDSNSAADEWDTRSGSRSSGPRRQSLHSAPGPGRAPSWAGSVRSRTSPSLIMIMTMTMKKQGDRQSIGNAAEPLQCACQKQ